MGQTVEVLLQLAFSLDNTKPAFSNKGWKNSRIAIMNKLGRFGINESNYKDRWENIYKNPTIRNVSIGNKTKQVKKKGGD